MSKDRNVPLGIGLLGGNAKVYNTIAEMQKDSKLKTGKVVEVLGYYQADDGATHLRVIAQEDDGSGVLLENGLYANIVHNGEVNVSWFGAKGDGVTDDTVVIQKAIDFTTDAKCICTFLPKDYLIEKPLYVYSYTNIKGLGGTVIIKNSNTTGEEQYSDIDAFFIVTGKDLSSDKTVYETKIESISCKTENADNDRYGIYARYNFAKYIIREFSTNKVGHSFYIKKGTWVSLLANSTFVSCKTGFVCENTSSSTTTKLQSVYVYESSEKAFSLSGGYFECNNLASDRATGINYELRFAEGTINGLGIESINCATGLKITNSNMLITTATVLPVENADSIVLKIDSSNVVFINSKFRKGKGQLYDITGTSNIQFNSCRIDEVFEKKSTIGNNVYMPKVSFSDNSSNIGTYNGYEDLFFIGRNHIDARSDSIDEDKNQYNISFTGHTHNGVVTSSSGKDLKYKIPLRNRTNIFVDNPKKTGYLIANVTSYSNKIKCLGQLTQSESSGSYRLFSITNFETEKTSEYGFYIYKGSILLINGNKYEVTNTNFAENKITLYSSDWTEKDDVLNKPIEIENDYRLSTEYITVPVTLSGEEIKRPNVNVQIGCMFFDTQLGKPIWWNGTSWIDSTGSVANSVQALNTPYHTTRMVEEGGTTLNDFYAYLDEKYAYDKQVEAEQKTKYEAYELLLKENPELTWEEFETQYSNSSMMNLSLVERLEEPQIPESVKKFMEKYLGTTPTQKNKNSFGSW